jgi:hypothetical protein
MARIISPAYAKQINATASTEPVLVLLELRHRLLAEPLRMVNDVADLTHDGQTYTALPFQISMPDEPDGKTPRAAVGVVNVGRDLVDVLEDLGGMEGAAVRVMMFNRADNAVEYSFQMDVVSCVIDVNLAQFELGYADFVNAPAVGRSRRPEFQPGVF